MLVDLQSSSVWLYRIAEVISGHNNNVQTFNDILSLILLMSRPDIDLELKTVASTSISCNHYKNNIGEIFQDELFKPQIRLV